MMNRHALGYLQEWKERATRKPLIIRGARQVGKSTLVRLFGEVSFDNLVTLNFEQNPLLGALFESNDPGRIITQLEVALDQRIVPGSTLLFLDEIQAAPSAITALRYFFEELPQLHVVAAGSLLDVALARSPLPAPVGRIEYLFLGPMSFGEYLDALGKTGLAGFLADWSLESEIPQAIHQQLMAHTRDFLAVGGMPEAVATFVSTASLRECERVKQTLLSTFRDDFAKYGPRVDVRRLDKVWRALPRLATKRFKFSHVDREERSRELAPALDLLCRARVTHRVRLTAANGPPLAAEAKDSKFKLLFLDVGLLLQAQGLSLSKLQFEENPLLINEGTVAEQFVGQQLLYSLPPFHEPELFFWARNRKSSNAEVDYLICRGTDIVPVEVKSGKTGTLKSLHMFLREKGRSFGVRLNTEPPSLLETTTALPNGQQVPYALLSLPLYLSEQLPRLVQRDRS